LFAYIVTTPVPSFPKTQAHLKISYAQANWTVGVPCLGLAIGPLFWSSLADIYGRRIIFILGTVISLVATIGCATAGFFRGYMAARFFQGLGVSPSSTVGLAIINEFVAPVTTCAPDVSSKAFPSLVSRPIFFRFFRFPLSEADADCSRTCEHNF
jgi:MFS family permease